MGKLNFFLVLCFAISVLAIPGTNNVTNTSNVTSTSVAPPVVKDEIRVEKHHFLGDKLAYEKFIKGVRKGVLEHKVRAAKSICSEAKCSSCVQWPAYELGCAHITVNPKEKQIEIVFTYGAKEFFNFNLTGHRHSFACLNLPKPRDYADLCYESENGLSFTGNTMQSCFKIFAEYVSHEYCMVYELETRELRIE